LFFFSLISLDQLLKGLARSSGFARFNHGILFGGELPLDSLNLNLWIVIFTILAVFLYFLLLIQMPKQVAGSRLGLTLLVSGIAGNGIDRLFFNKTTDYINLSIIDYSFNFADVCLFGGILLFFYLFYKGWTREKRQELRKNILVLPKDQVRLAGTFSLLILSAGLILGIFGAMFINIHFADNQLNGHLLLKKYVFLHAAVSLTISLMFFVFCLFFSHRLAGPVFGFLAYLKRNNGSTKGEFRSRDRDFFRIFEEMDKEITNKKN
jgi:lipoprotein signal peptidase